MRFSIAPLPAILCLLTLCAEPSYAGVWVVDQNGVADFTNIQQAVDAALDGDTILVNRPLADQWIQGFTVDGKGLTIVALNAERLPIKATEVRNLAPHQAFVFSGFRVAPEWAYGIHGGADPGAVGVLLADNAGSVRLQNCEIVGTHGWSGGLLGSHAVEVVASQDVTLVDCGAVGGGGKQPPYPGGSGVHTTNSLVGAVPIDVQRRNRRRVGQLPLHRAAGNWRRWCAHSER